MLILVLCEGYVVGYIKQRWEFRTKENRIGFSKGEAWCILGCIFFFAAASVITVIPDPDYFMMSSAITDLTNGSAKAYGEARKERVALYESGEKNVVVEELPSQPALLYFSDIKEDPNDWENGGLCRFYGLDSVMKVGK